MGLLKNTNTGTVLATRVDVATSFSHRFFGLLARATIQPDEGLWIQRCSAIHTVGMRAPIDVIFVDDGGRVVRVAERVVPYRLVITGRSARAVIELGAGALKLHNVLVGDRLELV